MSLACIVEMIVFSNPFKVSVCIAENIEYWVFSMIKNMIDGLIVIFKIANLQVLPSGIEVIASADMEADSIALGNLVDVLLVGN
jgi:hypothetical protein